MLYGAQGRDGHVVLRLVTATGPQSPFYEARRARRRVVVEHVEHVVVERRRGRGSFGARPESLNRGEHVFVYILFKAT